MKTGKHKIVAGSDGYVAEPFAFHDAIIRSVRQEHSAVEIIVELATEIDAGRKIRIECSGVYYVFYRADPNWNIMFGLWLFKNLDHPTANVNLPPHARHELDRIEEILNEFSPQKTKEVKGLVLYAEPMSENELLVHCECVTAELIE
jgi:hypothetical protein